MDSIIAIKWRGSEFKEPCNTIQYGCRVFPNRGSAIAKIVGVNAAALDKFDKTVRMWVFEEMVNGRKLTEIINTDHENVKYLPGHKLPPNVVSRDPHKLNASPCKALVSAASFVCTLV